MTVGLVIVSHSSQLAAGVAELATQMTQGATPIAAAGGAADGVLGTSVEKILAAISAVDDSDGVLILLDLGSAILSAEMALEMLEPEQREHIALSFAPLVEGALTASMEASLGHSLAEVRQAAEGIAQREQLLMLKPLSAAEEASSRPTEPVPSPVPGYLEAQLVLNNPTGLHARPASIFVQTAHRFHASIQALGRGREAEAISIAGVLSLGLRQGDSLTIRASGAEAEQALDALSALVRANFSETPSEPAAPTASKATPHHPQAPEPPSTRATWQGVPISAGVAVGPAFLYTANSLSLNSIERRSIADEQVLPEQERLRKATDTAIQELQAIAASVKERLGQSEAAIIEAQVLMLQDPALLEAALQMVQDQHLAAASALATAGEQQALLLEGLDDTLLAERAGDVRDAVSRALQYLINTGRPQQELSALDHPVILLAQDLTPSATSTLRPERVLGICTVQGGPTAHSAILARALAIPAMAGLSATALEVIHSGDEVGLDADRGLLYHHPTAEIRAQLTAGPTEHQ